VQWSLIRREAAGRIGAGTVRLPRHAGWVALAVVLASFAVFLAAGAKENSAGRLSANASRLTSLQSNRYDYWRVAWRAFKAEPIRGVGGGGWAVYWLRYRPFHTGAQDAHSLYVQTAAELGIVGLALLAAFLAGIVLAARRAIRTAPNLAAGLTAGVVVWAAHCAVDWDWEMPAVTLLALLLAGGLLALCELPPARPSSG
jgi:O-antigen ligase